ncbi:MAG: ParA family protein [Flavobacterium circumlabens]|uniref:ParA family protein n=1 Tax=Flavobacterium circumlabens TaxID=2133765 RepID=UPI00326395AE
MKTENQPVFVAFSSQKGGVGKSTFTALAASTLHYRLGYNVAVFDADFPQHSLMKMKERDLAMVMENEFLKKAAFRQFTAINKKAYPIFQHKAEGVLQAAHDFVDSLSAPVDYIFFDLPGTVNTPGILKALAGMHHIFSPITADRVVMESTLIFTQLMKDVIMKKGDTSIKTINLFWNQVDGRERSPLYEVYNKRPNTSSIFSRLSANSLERPLWSPRRLMILSSPLLSRKALSTIRTAKSCLTSENT